jgi:gliding motility-associated-like protein
VKKFLLFLGLSLLVFSGKLSASHYMGLDITYLCNPNGNNPCEYRIYHTTYYDCAGAATTPLPGPGPSVYGMTFTGNATGCTQPTSVGQCVFVSYIEVTPICPSVGTKCTNSTATLNGVLQNVYYCDYDFCNVNCTQYTIGYSTCCRNYAITSGAGGNSIGSFNTVINLGYSPCNSSPTFNNPPVPYICLNQSFTFNQGATDPDGDSLSYALVDCKQTSNTSPVTYNAGYSATAPLGPNCTVTIDPVTGDISMFPTTIEVGVMCVEVTEWRNGSPIGTVVRDMQITVINCGANDPPVNTGINLTGIFVDTVCGGTPLCFNIYSYDADSLNSQYVTMYWNSPAYLVNSGATFIDANNAFQYDTMTGPSCMGVFCWTPAVSNAGLNQFLVTVIDNNCPILGSNQYTFQIYVLPTLDFTTTEINTACNEITFSGVPNGGTGPYTYQWNGNGNLNLSPYLTDSTFSHLYPAPGTYDFTLTMVDANGCTGTLIDSIILNNGVTADAGGDITICSGSTQTINLGSQSLPGYSYSWNPAVGLSSATNAQPSIYYNTTVPDTHNYILTVTDGICQTVDYVTVYVEPVPVVTISGPASSCYGDSVLLVASGGTSYFWAPGGQTTDSIYVVPTLTSTYTVVAFEGGCASPPVSHTVTLATTVLAGAGPDASICDGQFIQLNGAAQGGTGNYSYSWTPTLNMVGANTQTPTVTPTDSTMYYFSVDDGCGIPAVDSVFIYLRPLPSADFVISDDSICIGQPTTITYTGTGAVTSNFIWNFGPTVGNIVGGSGPFNIVYALDGSHNVSLTVDENGCVGPVNLLPVFVYPPIEIALPPDSMICYGQQYQLDALATGGNGGPYTYQWSPLNGLNNASISNPIANPLYTTQFVVTVSDGCSPDNSNLINIAVRAPLEVTTNGDQMVCEDSLVQLQANITGGLGVYTIDWTPPTGLSNSTILNPVANPVVATTYTVVASDGCSINDTTYVTVGVHTPPNPPTPVNDTICQGEIANLYAIPQQGCTTWWYTQPTSTIAFNSGNGFITPPLQNTMEYYLGSIDSNGCPSKYFTAVSAIVNILPEVNFLADPLHVEIPNAFVNFDDDLFAPAGAYSWMWDFGDGEFDNLPNPVHQYQNEGTYTVTLIVVDSNGCSRSVTKLDYVVVGKDIQLIVPNAFTPNGDGINDLFYVGHKLINTFQVNIFDRWGNLLFTSRDPDFRWDGTLNGSPLPEGNYTYSITATAIENTPVNKAGVFSLLR